MIGYRIQQFLEAWEREEPPVQVFLAWNAANTVFAFLLLGGAVGLLFVMSAPGFQRTILQGYIVVAVAWLLSIFLIGPAYDRVVPPEAEAAADGGTDDDPADGET
jgi:hypothetical protein